MEVSHVSAAGSAEGVTRPAATQTVLVTDDGARQQALDMTPYSHTAMAASSSHACQHL